MEEIDKIDILTVTNTEESKFPVTGEDLMILRLATEDIVDKTGNYVLLAVGMLVSNPVTVHAEVCDLVIYSSTVTKNDDGNIDLNGKSAIVNGVYHNAALDEIRSRLTGEEMDEDYFGCLCELKNFELSVEQFTDDFRASIQDAAQELLASFVVDCDSEELSEGLCPAEEINIEECRKCGFTVDEDMVEEDEVEEDEDEDEEDDEEDDDDTKYDLTKRELTDELMTLALREADFCGIPEKALRISMFQQPGLLGEHVLIAENEDLEYLNLYMSDLDKAQEAIKEGKRGAHFYATVSTITRDKAKLLYDAIIRIYPDLSERQ